MVEDFDEFDDEDFEINDKESKIWWLAIIIFNTFKFGIEKKIGCK